MLTHIPRPLSGCLFFAHQHFPLCFISSAQEQIVGMLHNMSLNKKCHSHLANGVIINFITSVYQTEFYKTYGSRAESDAQRRTIKTILHTLTRLASDSPTLGAELLEQWHLPDLLRQSLALKPSSPQQHLDSSYGGDISHLARQLLGVHRQEQQLLLATPTPTGSFSSGHQTPEAQTQTQSNSSGISSSSGKTKAKTSSSSSLLKFNLTRQESFV